MSDPSDSAAREPRTDAWRPVLRASLHGLTAVAILTALVVVGSRKLHHFDAALFAYLFATLFAVFGITYRYSMWLQRPPTALYWKRGWQLFLRPKDLPRNLVGFARNLVGRIFVQAFIWRRGKARGLTHALLFWGVLLAAAITFPLVFGWIHFETVEGSFDTYRAHLFGFPTFTFPVHSLLAHLLFHGLVWSSFLVIAGVMLAFRRRMREHGAMAVQRFGEDVLPLVLLFLISVTGLLLWVSYEWMHGYAYDFLAILHAALVILTLLWLPFGKLFHVFQRPAQVGVALYQEVGRRSEQARCARCGDPYASKMHVEDLILVERRLGYRYEIPNPSGGGPSHYQEVCPRCRRAALAIAQGRLWQAASPAPSGPSPHAPPEVTRG
jgi:hypothetical protein